MLMRLSTGTVVSVTFYCFRKHVLVWSTERKSLTPQERQELREAFPEAEVTIL